MTPTTLEEASEFITDGTHGSPKRTGDANGIPLLSAKNVFDGEVRWDDFDRVPPSELEEFQKRVHLRAGDVLMTCVGTIGRAAVWLNERPVVFFRSVAIIRPKPTLLPKYLEYVIRSAGFQHELRRRTKRSSQGGIYLKDIKVMPLVVPPLAKQERIVKLLHEADELRKLRAQADRRTADLIPAYFYEMFGDPENNPKRWPRGTLKDFSAEIRYGLGQPPETDSEGVPMLRATNIKHGLISEEGLIRVRRDAIPMSRNAFLYADDVLVVRSGAYTGDAARVGEKWVDSVAGYDLVVSPKERFTGDFVAWFLLSRFVQGQYFQGLKTRAAQPHLNSEQVSETPFFCPPLTLQREFARRVTEIRELESKQSASRRCLEDLFQSLLHRAFQGEL